MANYISVPDFRNALRSSYDGADDETVLPGIIAACSSFLDRYQNRARGSLLTCTLDELYHGTGDTLLFLNNWPVQTISRVSTISIPAVVIHNTDADMGARATVQIVGSPSDSQNPNSQNASTGLKLTYVKNAVTTSNLLTWTSYATVTALVAAVNALGNNWQATVMGGFGSWSTTDLRATQGAFGAKPMSCYLWIHWLDIPTFRLNENTGELYSPMGFARGVDNWRISGTYGFTKLPEDLTQAIAELCAATYYARETNANMQKESLGPYSYSRFTDNAFKGLSDVSRRTIDHFKVRRARKYSAY